MKTSDIRAMSADQQQEKLLELKKAQFNLRCQQATGQLENRSQFLKLRREIAQLKTIMRETGAAKTQG